MTSEEHATLVQSAGRGDEPSIAALLERHLPALRAFLRLRSPRVLRDLESSSDLAQSVCREVLGNLDGFEYRGEAAFRAWLFAKGLSKVQDRGRYYMRKKRDPGPGRRQVAGDEDEYRSYYVDLVTPSRVAMGREEIFRVEAAFDELPDDYREVLTLQRVAGLSYTEIAAEMGRSAGSVRGLAERAVRRLAWILARTDTQPS